MIRLHEEPMSIVNRKPPISSVASDESGLPKHVPVEFAVTNESAVSRTSAA